MSTIEKLAQEYSKHINGIHSYTHIIISRYDKGYIGYEKAIRLESKINEWIRVYNNRMR